MKFLVKFSESIGLQPIEQDLDPTETVENFLVQYYSSFRSWFLFTSIKLIHAN